MIPSTLPNHADLRRTPSEERPRARVERCAFRVCKSRDAYSIEGPPEHYVGHDPVAGETGARYSLEAGWSFAEARLTVFGDRLGIIPIYFRASDREIVVADSLTALAALCPDLEIDPFEVYAFLKLGVYLGSATPFLGVQRLRPKERVVWQDGRLERFHPHQHSDPFEGTRQEALTEANRLFTEAVRKRMHGHLRPVIPISGGRDSRHILLELARQGAQSLQTVTVRTMHDYREDVRVGALVARAVGAAHRVLDNDHRLYFRHMAEQFATNEFESLFHEWMRAMPIAYPDRDTIFFDGLGGDALLNSAYAHVLPHGMIESVKSGDIERMADLFAGGFDPPGFLRRLPDAGAFARKLKTRLVAEISRHRDAPDPMCRFMFEHRTRRATSIGPIGSLARVAEVSLPYLDSDLVDFSYRLPAPEYWWPGFHDEMITQRYPEFSHIPFENRELLAHAGIDRTLQLRLMFASLALLLRHFRPTVVKTFHALTRLLYHGARLRMKGYFYIADSELYYQTLRAHAARRRRGTTAPPTFRQSRIGDRALGSVPPTNAP